MEKEKEEEKERERARESESERGAEHNAGMCGRTGSVVTHKMPRGRGHEADASRALGFVLVDGVELERLHLYM